MATPLPPYRRGQVTQKAAAQKVASATANMRTVVLDYIRSCGLNGATNEEISHATGIKLQTVCGRVNELQGNYGWPAQIWHFGFRKTQSKVNAKVWICYQPKTMSNTKGN